MALNLARNSRVFFTTNVDSVGAVNTAGHDTTKTFEVQVLDGFTFSQTTNTETVTINEAGATPVRGQRAFNTSLAPVDFSFSTYIRPALLSGAVTGEEAPLWKALTSVTGNSWVETGTDATLTMTNSAANQLQKFGLVFLIDNVTYVIDNCAMNQVSIDFGIDAIATATWSGNGNIIKKLPSNITVGTYPGSGLSQNFTAGLTGTFKSKNVSAGFIANKLSTCTITGGGTTYTVALTGGNFTLNNNITFLTPANLAVVNTPITYFTGTRSVTGTVNAYLKTGGSDDTGALLATMLSSTSTVSPNYSVVINIGGTTGQRVNLSMPTSSITIPSVDIQQVVSTAINFTAQSSVGGTAGSDYDITQNNELTAKYYAS